MFHQSHASISRPTLLVTVADNVLIVRIWMLRQVPLDQVSRLLSSESVQYDRLRNNMTRAVFPGCY